MWLPSVKIMYIVWPILRSSFGCATSGAEGRAEPVGALKVVVAAERVLLPDGDVCMVQASTAVAQVVCARGLLDRGGGLQRGVEHLQRHADRVFRQFFVAGHRRGREAERGGTRRARVMVVMVVAAGGRRRRLRFGFCDFFVAVQEVFKRLLLECFGARHIGAATQPVVLVRGAELDLAQRLLLRERDQLAE